jgi:hypothetical protein
VDDEVADQHHREEPVENARALHAAEHAREVLGPQVVGEEQRQAGERQAEEAEDDERVVDAVDAVEPLDRLLPAPVVVPRVRAMLDAVDERPREPQHRVQPKNPNAADIMIMKYSHTPCSSG